MDSLVSSPGDWRVEREGGGYTLRELQVLPATLRNDRLAHSLIAIPAQKRVCAEGDDNARKSLAVNDNLCVEVQEALARDKNYIVRHVRAKRAEHPDGVLALLAADSDYRVRLAVAANRVTPQDLLEQLSMDPLASVQLRLAGNASLEWTTRLGLQFVREYHVELYENSLAEVDPEFVTAFADTWQRSVKDFLEAAGLVRR